MLRGALHVTNGDIAAEKLGRTGLVDRVVPWRDALHEGPVPALDPDGLRAVRAQFLSTPDPAVDEDEWAEEHAHALGLLTERDLALESNRTGAYVLWFEADLYDQLQLIEILSHLADLGVTADAITLICIGEHPRIARFAGLGQLDAAALARLPATAATTMTEASLALAQAAWAAWRSPDPERLAAIAETPSTELRYLGEAFDRLAREYPWTRDGLALSERRVIAAVADGAPTAAAAFVGASSREIRPYLGDTWCFRSVARLVNARTPLLAVAEPGHRRIGRETPLRVTEAGWDVLHGRLDHVGVNGVDRWLGGVHLVGKSVPWRWHDGVERLVPTTS